MANKYDYLDDFDDYLDDISDASIRKGVGVLNSAKWHAGQEATHHLRKSSNKETWNTPEKLEEGRIRTQQRWDDPQFHKKTADKIVAVTETEEWRNKLQNGLDEYWSENRGKGLRASTKNSNFKGVCVGTSIADGSEVRFTSKTDMKNNGFIPAKIYECINGNRNKHKGYTWRRETEGEMK